MIDQAHILRLVKAALVAVVAAYAFLAGVSNLTDYSANFPYVQHVLLMDTTFRNPDVMGRAITAPWAHHLAFAAIIVAELVSGGVAGLAAWRMAAARRDIGRYLGARALAAAGLTLALLLWFGGFLVIAGEWFQMWQSTRYNAQGAAFQYVVPILLVLVLLLLPEPDAR